MDFSEAIAANDGGVVRMRRDLHAHPELGFLEYRTASKAAALLHRLGWQVKVGPEVMVAAEMLDPPSPEVVRAAQEQAIAEGAPAEWVARMPGGQTGVVAELRRGEGPVLAFRFDMDALPVAETEAPSHEPNGGGYRSRHPGVMHACGHDGHTAIGLALAARLAQGASGWQGTIRLIFQPAEEGGRGARPMVAAGVVDDVDHFFVGHLGCLLPSGQVAPVASDFLFSAKLDASFTGQAAHAAMGPQEGRNALLAGATAALGLHGITRHAGAPTFVNVGRMVAGTGRNVVADHCQLLLELRGGTREALEHMERRAREVLAGAAAMHGVTVEVRSMGGTIGFSPSPEAAGIVAEVAAGTEGISGVTPSWPIGGGDDATFLIERVQERGGKATYFLLGSDLAGIHHASDFDIDEAALHQGVALFAGIADRILRPA
ncbi:amidohydrolase [Roseomonas sp. BN140053]|uniref:amidohydrolase n=1 Tax=Roseomonas sp. BN140053 TaxID=3391898 RepID=UPI0039EB7B1D